LAMWSRTRCATDWSSIAAFIPAIPCPPFCQAYALQCGGQKKLHWPHVSPIQPFYCSATCTAPASPLRLCCTNATWRHDWYQRQATMVWAGRNWAKVSWWLQTVSF